MHIAGAEWEDILGFWTFQGHFHWRNPGFVCMLGIICASLVLFHLLQKHSKHSAFAVQNRRNLFLFFPPEIANIAYYLCITNINMTFPGIILYSAFQEENSKCGKRDSCKPQRALQYIQYLRECIPHASFSAQHQAAAQQSFPQFISSSLISWCSCIVVWEQTPQASSPSH